MKASRNSGQKSALERRAGLSRRHFLRGVGACLALPALESLFPWKLTAANVAGGGPATTAAGAPLRTAFIFFPNGAIQPAWWPGGEGAGFKFNSTLQPLEDCRDQIRVLGGLDHREAIGGPDGGGDHARGNAVFLTGCHVKKSATNLHVGTSIDQMMARKIGHMTRFPSLELTCDDGRKTGACDSNYSCAYQYNLSWSSPTTPVPAEFNPRSAFERLFGSGEHGQRVQNNKVRQQTQQSILDFVMADAHDMERRLNGNDRDKLDQYLTSVREVETRIQRAERFGPTADPTVETPAGVPADQNEYVEIMYELMALAFQTDSTRIATFCLAHDGDNRSFSHIGIPEGHHDLSHHENNADRIAKVARIDQWYVQKFAGFLKRLEGMKDLDGRSILYNSMIVYGGGNADGNIHSHTNLPIVLAGGGGGALSPAAFNRFHSEPACNLFLSLADRMGVQGLDRFGDSTGRLAKI